MPSKSAVVPELVQVVTSVPSTDTSTVLALVAPLYIAGYFYENGGGLSLRIHKAEMEELSVVGYSDTEQLWCERKCVRLGEIRLQADPADLSDPQLWN